MNVATRWLIDGMNVIGTRPDGWWNDPDVAMAEMAYTLGEYARQTGDEVTVVFDRKPREFPPVEGARVVFASWKGRNAADHEIEMMLEHEADPSTLHVVTSDKRLADKVRALGVRVVSSGRFRDRLEELAER
ncbi:MAG: NYN domain-containing protein [Actinomycetota bacterium]